MNNILVLFVFIIGGIFVLPTENFAQEQTDGVPSVRKIQELFKERDPLAETLNQVSAMKEEFNAKQTGVDNESVDLLRTLKNPFIPQLPVVEVGSVPKNVGVPQAIVTVSPVSPSAEGMAPTPTVSIAGVVWNTDRPQAIVNGHVVNVGDKVEAWTIVGISKQGIEISLEGRNYLIALPSVSTVLTNAEVVPNSQIQR